jgi:hypothetical protein
MGRYYLKFLIFLILCLQVQYAHAEQVRILVSPVNVISPQSSYSIYRNISEFISTDIINALNKNTNYDVIDIAAAEDLLKSRRLYEEYRSFLANYKDTGAIDYKLCLLLSQKLGVDKLLLVSSSFNAQELILKKPFWDQLRSYNRLNVETALIDTQTGIMDFDNPYHNNIKINDYEFPSDEIRKFSKKVAENVVINISAQIEPIAYSRVQSSIVSNTREGTTTRDGHSFFTDNKYLNKNRIDSFKQWVRENVDL